MNITITPAGIEQILQILGANHKLGRDHFTPNMLAAWAREVEDHAMDTGEAYLEIRAADSVFGRTMTFTITPAGYEVVKFDDEE